MRPTSLGEDRHWLAVLAGTTLVEASWWAVCWSSGVAPAPLLGTYLALTLAALAAALVVRLALRLPLDGLPWASALIGAVLVAVGASFFLPLKFAIPNEIPFWLDGPLASGERALLGVDPWLLLDRLFGWATMPADRVYALWLPVQSLVLFMAILAPPSQAKSRALIAYSLAWLLLGVAAALLFSSAGPIFYDRIFGGQEFALLHETLRSRRATAVLAASDMMWTALDTGRPGLVAGISAFPSLHVAISLWIFLMARTMAPRAAPVALVYFIFILVASVQLGWHYVSDGLGGALGMVAIWAAAAPVERLIRRRWGGPIPSDARQQSPETH